MGAMASYSGQIFNNFIGFSINILGGLGTSDEFDIFALNRNKDARPGNEKPMPITSIFIMFVIISVLSVLSLGLVYLFTNDFTLKKSYTVLLLIFYGGFFGISLMFGYFSSTA